jgi:hypothetical protein
VGAGVRAAVGARCRVCGSGGTVRVCVCGHDVVAYAGRGLGTESCAR